jgi:hypothetical protein
MSSGPCQLKNHEGKRQFEIPPLLGLWRSITYGDDSRDLYQIETLILTNVVLALRD